KCHRLAPHILRASQALIKKHRGPRLDKGIEVPTGDGRRVQNFICTTDDIEVELVATLIKKELEQHKDGRQLSYKDVMVLCPTRAIANSLAARLQEKHKIPVRKLAPNSIPEELWRILLVLRLALEDDNLALRQWLDVLKLPRED